MESYARRNNGAFYDIENAGGESSPKSTLDALLENKPITREQLNALYKKCEGPYALVGVKVSAQGALVDASNYAEVHNDAPDYATGVTKGSRMYVLIPYADVRRIANGAAEMSKLARYAIAFSLPFDQVESIPQQRKLVDFCLESTTRGNVRNAQDLALPFLISEIAKSIEVGSFLHPALEKLARYDKANQSNLLKTLEVYLDHDRNAQRCANELYLHRNSLQYRVRRIQEIAGINLDDPEERAYLRLSFLLS